MILVSLTINGTVHRISDEYCELTHLWEAKVAGLTPVSYATKSNAGGYVEPSYGDIELLPDLFAGDWPPPKSCACTVKITDTTEEAAVTIFTGTAHRAEINREGIKYELHGPSYSSALTAKTWIDGTLNSVFTTYCGASYLNLTFNSTYERATSPAVYGVFDSDTTVIEMLSALAEATNHLFYISGSTLYLVDMLLDNGTAVDVDEFDFFPVEYSDTQPFKLFQTEGVNRTYRLAGTYAYGDVDDSDVAGGVEHLYGRFGNNSGNDQLWLITRNSFEYETGKYYMMKVKVRRPLGSAAFIAGILGYASDRSTIVDRNGGTNYALGSWHCASSPGLSSYTSAWLTKTGYSSGWTNPASFAEAANVASPGTLYDNGAGTKAVNFRPVLIFNSSAAAGVMELDYVGVWEVDSSGNILEELMYQDFTDTAQLWEWSNYSGNGNRGIYTSAAASVTAMATHLGNRKTILESPRATISLPLTAANLVSPGQRINWTDESVVPDATNYINISAYIRVRSISFDIEKSRITYEGEGGIS